MNHEVALVQFTDGDSIRRCHPGLRLNRYLRDCRMAESPLVRLPAARRSDDELLVVSAEEIIPLRGSARVRVLAKARSNVAEIGICGHHFCAYPSHRGGGGCRPKPLSILISVRS
jgi:hypothetical protein